MPTAVADSEGKSSLLSTAGATEGTDGIAMGCDPVHGARLVSLGPGTEAAVCVGGADEGADVTGAIAFEGV